MKKSIFIISFLFILMLSLVTATLYDLSVTSVTDVYNGDSDNSNVYVTQANNLYRYNEALDSSSLIYALSVAYNITQVTHYSNELIDDIDCFKLEYGSTDFSGRINCKINWGSFINRISEIGINDSTDMQFIGDYIYVFYEDTQSLEEYSVLYNNVTHDITFSLVSNIYLNPNIEASAIAYNINDEYVYYYSKTNSNIIKSDLTGSYLASENVVSDYNITDFYNINNTWYFISSDSDKVILSSTQQPLGTFEYLGGEYWASQNCIDSTSLCTNTQYIIDSSGNVELWCDIDDTIYCDALCSDDNIVIGGVTANTGYCEEASCSSECSFDGFKECTTSSSYRECGQFDSDICLEYAPVTQCLTNQYCSIGNCIDYNFSSISDKTVSLPSMYLKPTVSTDEGITTKKDVNGVYQISTEYNSYNQLAQILSPLTSQTFYNAYTCDYQETSLIEATNYTSNNTFNVEVNANEEISFTSFEIVMNGNNSINFSIGNGVSNIASYYLTYNENTYNLIVTDVYSQTLINDTGNYAYDDLESIEFILSNDKTGLKAHNLYAILNRATQVDYQVIPIDYENDVSYLDFDLVSTNNVSINNFKVSYVDTLPAYDSLTLGDDSEISCIYTKTGCYTLRSYVMGVDYSLYNNYEDIEVCVNVLGGTPKLDTTKSLGDELAGYGLTTRLLLMGFVVGLISVVFFVVGDNDNKARRVVGVGLLALTMILFVAVGLVPVWIIILLFVVIALFATGIIGRVMGFN